MSDDTYTPKGNLYYSGKQKDGTGFVCSLEFSSLVEMGQAAKWAKSVNLVALCPSPMLLSSASPSVANGSNPDAHDCYQHLRPNKKGGSHTHYCSKKLSDGRYCGKKVNLNQMRD